MGNDMGYMREYEERKLWDEERAAVRALVNALPRCGDLVSDKDDETEECGAIAMGSDSGGDTDLCDKCLAKYEGVIPTHQRPYAPALRNLLKLMEGWSG